MLGRVLTKRRLTAAADTSKVSPSHSQSWIAPRRGCYARIRKLPMLRAPQYYAFTADNSTFGALRVADFAIDVHEGF